MEYKQWIIPAGVRIPLDFMLHTYYPLTYIAKQTIISMNITDIHFNESLFSNPKAFIPERWLDGELNEHYLVPFGRDSRVCLGRK